jgi:NAD(P)H-hydrate epimerase
MGSSERKPKSRKPTPAKSAAFQAVAVSVAQMYAIDRTAIETLKIPRLLLMEHAGFALARCVQALKSYPSKRRVLVCCGTGYNGGDGLCAARHLHNWGYHPHVVLAGEKTRLREEPAVYATIVERLGLPLQSCPSKETLRQIEPWVMGCDVVIDALLGIGAHGAMREPIASLIDLLNHSGKPIIAADIPSGLDADTGLAQGIAIYATATVAFGLPKQGCFLKDGPAHTGTLHIDPITLPPKLIGKGKTI